MAYTRSYEAIVLRSIDIGEADRFCIFFTRSRGKFAARARGVRKPMSRMGGSLLPFSHVRIDIAETENSLTVTSASAIIHDPRTYTDYDMFRSLQRGAEIVAQLTEDDEPLPQVFDLLLVFLHAVSIPGCNPLLPFTLCLLHLLGLLPAREEELRFARLPEAAKAFIHHCIRSADIDTLCTEVPESSALSMFTESILNEHLQRPLKG